MKYSNYRKHCPQCRPHQHHPKPLGNFQRRPQTPNVRSFHPDLPTNCRGCQEPAHRAPATEPAPQRTYTPSSHGKYNRDQEQLILGHKKPLLEMALSLSRKKVCSFWDDGHQSGHHQHIPLQVASRVPLTALTGVIAGMSSMKSKNVIHFEGPEGTVAKTKPFEAKPCP